MIKFSMYLIRCLCVLSLIHDSKGLFFADAESIYQVLRLNIAGDTLNGGEAVGNHLLCQVGIDTEDGYKLIGTLRGNGLGFCRRLLHAHPNGRWG